MAVHAGVDIHPLKEIVTGLYVTAREAYEAWKADPETGDHPRRSHVRGGPLRRLRDDGLEDPVHRPDDASGTPPSRCSQMKPLPDFVARVKQVATPEHTIMAMCRSGGRSAMALNVLAKAGFTKLYNIIDGMEGDVVEDAESVFVGQRLRNGWKNAGCPWTYKLTPDRLLLPSIEKRSRS